MKTQVAWAYVRDYSTCTLFSRVYHNPSLSKPSSKWNENQQHGVFLIPSFCDVGSFLEVFDFWVFKWMLNVPFVFRIILLLSMFLLGPFPECFLGDETTFKKHLGHMCQVGDSNIYEPFHFFCLRFLSRTATRMTHDDSFMLQLLLRCGIGIQHCECSGCIDYRKVMRQKRVHQSAFAKMVFFWWKRWVLREQKNNDFWGKDQDLESSKRNNQIIWNTSVFSVISLAFG